MCVCVCVCVCVVCVCARTRVRLRTNEYVGLGKSLLLCALCVHLPQINPTPYPQVCLSATYDSECYTCSPGSAGCYGVEKYDRYFAEDYGTCSGYDKMKVRTRAHTCAHTDTRTHARAHV